MKGASGYVLSYIRGDSGRRGNHAAGKKFRRVQCKGPIVPGAGHIMGKIVTTIPVPVIFVGKTRFTKEETIDLSAIIPLRMCDKFIVFRNAPVPSD